MLKILVAAHDAGGANILNALVKKYAHNFNWKIYAKGPAAKIFNVKSAGHIVGSEKPDLILTGTSWESNLEIDFIRYARNKGIRTASFLDHWCNYRERFGYPGNWKKNLPDIVFVGDKWAYDIAFKKGFPRRILRKVENPYFEEIAKEAALFKGKNRENNIIRILYLSQPVSRHALKCFNVPSYWGYNEFDVLKDLLNIIEACGNSPVELRVRFHPSEKNNKYDALIKNKGITITKSKGSSLVQDCMMSDIIIGSDSMALIVALRIGKYAVSYVPDTKKTCSLPQKEIRRIHSINELTQEMRRLIKNGPIKNHKNKKAFNRAFFKEAFDRQVC